MSEELLGKIVEINQKVINLLIGIKPLSEKEFSEIDKGEFVSVNAYLNKRRWR